MIVTNGSRINPEWLESLNGKLDWIALSIDSFENEAVNVSSGRAISRQTANWTIVKCSEAWRMDKVRRHPSKSEYGCASYEPDRRYERLHSQS
jgi:hypothetical protein